MDFTIRRMESEDIPDVFAIDKDSAALYWPERSYHFEVETNEASRPFVAVDETGRILGFIVFWLIIDEAHLANFAVRAEVRCCGVGRALLNHGLRICYESGARVSFLEVRAGNEPAIHLYESSGYHTESVRKQYYQDNHEDALLMNLDPEDYKKLIHGVG
jgi:ribosomal-protein-alanine N-acetyltransferase